MIYETLIPHNALGAKRVSSCCFAGFTFDFTARKPKCNDCRDHCEVRLPPCPLNICDGSKEVANLVLDRDTHEYYQDGSVPCLCATD